MEANNKKCCKCKDIKSLEMFYNDKNSKDGKGPTCKPCRKIESNRSLSKPSVREKAANNAKKWRTKNKDSLSAYFKTYKRNAYHKEKCKHHYKLLCALFRKTRNLDKTIDLIGCSANEFRKHIFGKLKNHMSIENHGKVWELDHIIPVRAFNIFDAEEVKRAFHYTNIQPLEKEKQLSKSDKMPNGQSARTINIRQQDDIWLAYNSI